MEDDMATLVQVNEVGEAQQRWTLGDKPILVGRDPECQIRLADQRASRRHLEVAPRGVGYAVTDLGSANGSLLNGRVLVTTTLLVNGDRLQVGGVTLVFEAGDTKGLGTIISELAQEATESGKGYRTMLREISRDSKE
jgi:pSer/pThr/pTyr-binding forkhead associated (FHA) protein